MKKNKTSPSKNTTDSFKSAVRGVPTAALNAKAVRVNVSMPPLLRQISDWVVTVRGYSGLSDYLQANLRRDAAALGAKHFALASPMDPQVGVSPELTCGING